jgi:hypothetical protein
LAGIVKTVSFAEIPILHESSIAVAVSKTCSADELLEYFPFASYLRGTAQVDLAAWQISSYPGTSVAAGDYEWHELTLYVQERQTDCGKLRMHL